MLHSRETPNWKEWDLAMVPLHGLCTVVAIREESILGNLDTYVTLHAATGEEVVKIPLARLEERGVRQVADADTMADVLAQPLVMDRELLTWPSHQRMRSWIRRLRGGSPGIRRQILFELRRVEASGSGLSRQEQDLRARLDCSLRQEIERALNVPPARAARLAAWSMHREEATR